MVLQCWEARQRDLDQRGSPVTGKEGIQTRPSLPPLFLLRQQALLRPGPAQATSRIFYEPDAYDDLDQEDPDDDLDV